MVRFNMDRIVWFYNKQKWLPFYDTAATFVLTLSVVSNNRLLIVIINKTIVLSLWEQNLLITE